MAQYDIPLKDYLNSINLKQGDLSEDPIAMKKYPAYVINKCMMHHIDTLMHANEMNACQNLDSDLQYQYLLYSVRKSKRFSPWDKKIKDGDLDLVKQYYGYNNEKAQEALKTLTKNQIKIIASKLNTGGKK